jgi:hypothetical protein
VADDALSRVMFWVGLMFVATPILVVAVVLLTRRHLRRKRERTEPEGRLS